jgi:signal transduction histidine kinase
MLVARSRRSRAHREALTLRALRASEEERRRIAGTLHDGVVQQLAAASFTVAGTAERAVAAGHRELAADLDAVAATVRDGIAGLRSLLVGIYPPSLHSSGLAVALRDLARTGAGDADVGADIDADAADALPEHVQEAAFGVAQEALRNADKHAAARHVTLSLHRDGDVTRLEIADDGRGFEPRPAFDTAGTGHFGLQLMVDAARRGGARLAVASAPGRGSRVRFETVTS